MSGFKLIEGEYAIISQSGVYRQVPLAERDGFLFAAISSSSYVQLRTDASTSKDKVRLVELSWDGPLHGGGIGNGKLCRPGVRGSKPLEDEKLLQLTAPELN